MIDTLWYKKTHIDDGIVHHCTIVLICRTLCVLTAKESDKGTFVVAALVYVRFFDSKPILSEDIT